MPLFEGVIFTSLRELLLAVGERDNRQPFLVKFKAKDHYCLAESEAEALAAVVESQGAQCGPVPLDLIMREAKAIAGGSATVQKINLSMASAATVKEIATKHGIDSTGKKADLIPLIMAVDGAADLYEVGEPS